MIHYGQKGQHKTVVVIREDIASKIWTACEIFDRDVGEWHTSIEMSAVWDAPKS